eukprot:2390605-Alexandrium_andersonii.AAC.1
MATDARTSSGQDLSAGTTTRSLGPLVEVIALAPNPPWEVAAPARSTGQMPLSAPQNLQTSS